MTAHNTPGNVDMLLALGRTPGEVATRLEAELSRLNAVLEAAQPYWHSLIPGREWTAAQECEHIVLVSEAGAKVAGLLLSERPISEQQRVPVTLSASGKRQAPQNMQPSAHPGPLSEYQPRLEALTRSLPALARQASASSERLFYHPSFGDIDALNWLRVTAGHMRGHRLELEKLLTSGESA